MNGRISDERFAELSADYEQEEAALKARAAELQAELEKAQEATVNVEKFMGLIRKYTNFEELTHTLLREFVEKILVHEATAEDGKRRGTGGRRLRFTILLWARWTCPTADLPKNRIVRFLGSAWPPTGTMSVSIRQIFLI